jgi:hypothetical protein
MGETFSTPATFISQSWPRALYTPKDAHVTGFIPPIAQSEMENGVAPLHLTDKMRAIR